MRASVLKFPEQAEQFTLRPYQVKAVEDIRQSMLRGNRRALLQATCGSGKTVVASDVIQRAVAKGSRVLFFAHRRELIDQCSDKLHRFGVAHGVIMAGRQMALAEQVQVGSIQTLWSRRDVLDIGGVDLIVVDECHRSLSRTYRALIKKHSRAHVLGLTATPCRTDGRGLGHIYQDMVCAPSIAELTAQGYLVPVRYFGPDPPDLSGVDIDSRTSDYVQGQLGRAMDQPKLIADAIDQWEKHGDGRPTLVFASSVCHSQHLAGEFQAKGYAFEHIDGTTPPDERDQHLADLREGRLQGICNCEVFTEGTDLPLVSCIVLAKPTKSIGRYLQMAGRGLRPHPGKENCVLIDHTGAVTMHGFLDDPIPWSLDVEGKVQDRKKREKGEKLPIVCEECDAIYSGRRDCPNCGALARVVEPAEHAQGDLVELTCRAAGMDDDRITWFRQLRGMAKERGYHWKWVDYSYKSVFGEKPHSSLRALPASRPGEAVRDWVSRRHKEYAAKRGV